MRGLSGGLSALMRAIGIAWLVVLVPLALFVLTEPPSFSGAAYVLGPVVIAVGAVIGGTWQRRFLVAGTALVLVTLTVRLLSAKGRAVDRIIDERDITINASRALGYTHVMSDPDVPRLPREMRAAYREMASAGIDLPSPILSTWIGLERPGSSETLEVAGDGTTTPRDGRGRAGRRRLSPRLRRQLRHVVLALRARRDEGPHDDRVPIDALPG